MDNKKKDLLFIGECMIELNGEPLSNMRQSYGGDSLNTAVYLSRCVGQAHKISYATVMGNDALSDRIVQCWKEEGIDTQFVLQDDKHKIGLYLIQLDENGERTFLYWREHSAAKYLLQHPDFFKIEQKIETADLIYLSGISLAILPHHNRLNLIDLLEKASKRGAEIIFDTNYRPALWDNCDQAKMCYSLLLPYTTLALVTDDDERALWKDQNSQQTLTRLLRDGVQKVVVKQGAKGALYQDAKETNALFEPSLNVENVLDTTSAGDAFNAGFLQEYLSNGHAKDAMKNGHHLASLVIAHKGAVIARSAMKDLCA